MSGDLDGDFIIVLLGGDSWFDLRKRKYIDFKLKNMQYL